MYEEKFIKRVSLKPIDSPYGHCAANPGNDKNFQRKLDQNIAELLTQLNKAIENTIKLQVIPNIDTKRVFV